MIKANNQNPVKTRQKFDQTFKREAVNHWKASGKSAGIIARELGMLPNRLYAWEKIFAPVAVGHQPVTAVDLQAQLNAARREIRHLTEQRDILKKTLGILSEPLPNAMNGSTR